MYALVDKKDKLMKKWVKSRGSRVPGSRGGGGVVHKHMWLWLLFRNSVCTTYHYYMHVNMIWYNMCKGWQKDSLHFISLWKGGLTLKKSPTIGCIFLSI